MSVERERIEPPFAGGETVLLAAGLDTARRAFLDQLSGLDDERARRVHQPSGLSLLWLGNDLRLDELFWFRHTFANEYPIPDLGYFWDQAEIAPELTLAAVVTEYQAETAHSRRIAATTTPAAPAHVPFAGGEVATLRWIMLHMIEETARHVGKAERVRATILAETGTDAMAEARSEATPKCSVAVMERCQRTDPPYAVDEKTMISAFLDWQRATLLCKLQGLTDEQVRWRQVPSGPSLLAIVKHLAAIERDWFRDGFSGETITNVHYSLDAERYWRIEPGETTASVRALYEDEVARSRAIAATSLDEPARNPGRHQGASLRWIILHMIAETARHNGHVDLIRQAIDGEIGD